MIKGKLINDETVVAQIDKLSVNVLFAIRRFVTEFTYKMARTVSEDKLAGQVLKRRTGNLARSIMRGVGIVETSSGIVGVVGLGGADLKVAKYGAVHEYGYKGTVSIKAFTRKNGVGVRAHSRKIDLPERSFLRSTLREKQADFVAGLNKAIEEARKLK